MAAKNPSPKRKSGKSGTEVLGRSAATGRKVLKPASSATTAVTMEEAYYAVKSVLEKK